MQCFVEHGVNSAELLIMVQEAELKEWGMADTWFAIKKMISKLKESGVRSYLS